MALKVNVTVDVVADVESWVGIGVPVKFGVEVGVGVGGGKISTDDGRDDWAKTPSVNVRRVKPD